MCEVTTEPPSDPQAEPMSSPEERAAPKGLDALMERASQALIETRYFEAASLTRRALGQAITRRSWDDAARICLPAQEARRQIRQLACDAGEAGARFLVAEQKDMPEPFAPGLYLLKPPLIGADGRTLRLVMDRRELPAMVLTREPMTRAGEWPVVQVDGVVCRARVEPPYPVTRVETAPTKDDATEPPDASWFQRTAEAIGDAAIDLALEREQPAAHRAEELLDAIDAAPDHEKLYQRLAEACREARREPEPILPRQRGPINRHGF